MFYYSYILTIIVKKLDVSQGDFTNVVIFLIPMLEIHTQYKIYFSQYWMYVRVISAAVSEYPYFLTTMIPIFDYKITYPCLFAF